MEAVEAVATELEAEAAACEDAGKLTERALELLRGTGIGWSMVGRDLGGMGMYPGDVFPVLERISRIDGAIGWISTILASSGPFLAHLERTVAEALVKDGLPVFAASGAPTGRAVRVDGGYRFSGSYSYSSGGLHADWVFCSGMIYDGDHPIPGPPLSFLIPTSAVTHLGNWDTLGLRGTGSVDFNVTDYFVPDEHAIDMFASPVTGGPEAGGGIFLDIHLMHLGFASGITRRLLDEVAAHSTQPSRRPGAPRLADNPGFRAEFADRELAARSGRALISDVLADIDATLAQGAKPSRRQITLLFGANVQMHDTARATAVWAFSKGGGTALRAGTLQRLVRDTLSGCQHILVDRSHLNDIGHELLGATEDMVWMGPMFVSAAAH